MYCTVKEIIRDVLDTDVPDSECVFVVVLTRGDVRHIAQDWSLTDDELETVMQRLDDAFEHGADVSVVHDVVRELMEEKRASRHVTVPAVMLEKVMALAGSEMGQKPLTTAQIVDEICDFVANQQAVFLGGHYILQGSRNR
ncbi:DUF1380 family protein [Escherichia coli]|nr:DUF1380 family protein [Escherichia coli]